jgi:predicted nuclease with TOPRIM domain
LKDGAREHPRLVDEPGLDLHEWETRWQALEPELETSPGEALPELADLVKEMLETRGYDLDDPVMREGEDREVVADFLAAREITQRYDRGDDGVSPGDLAAAINAFRDLYHYLVDERRAP